MTIETVPLSSLQPPAANPRTAVDPATLDGLAASIKQDRVLQNLIVEPAKGKRNRFRIVSGERRYRALLVLKDRGDIDGDYPVPVEIRKGLSKDDALRIATVENLQREDLPPLDQAAALAGLIRNGATLEDIVAKTGLSASTIKRRLALNSLCDDAKQGLRDGVLSLARAEALTLGTHEAQRLVILDMVHGYYGTAEEIREQFLDGRPTVAMAIFPREQYTGSLTTDLFQAEEESYFDDAEQFMALQKQAVAELARSYEDKGAFVDVTESHRVPEWQYEKANKRNRKSAGVVINLSPSGVVEIREGLIKPKKIDRATAAETADSPLAPVKRKPAYPVPLCRLIAWHKSVAVQEVLLANPRKARELSAIDQLERLEALRPHDALREFVKHSEPQISYTVVDTQAGLMARVLGEDAKDGDAGWQTLIRNSGTDVDLYDRLKTLTDDQLDQLLLVLAVLPFGQSNCDRHDGGDSLFNAVARDLEIDMRNHWRPDGDFFNRRTVAQLAAIAKECGFADGHSAVHTWKKAELVNGLLRHFEHARNASAPTPPQQKALTWLPDAMRFPAIDPDAGEQPAADTDAEDSD